MAENSGLEELIRRNDWRVEMAQFDEDATRRLVEAYRGNLEEIERQMDAMIQEMREREGDEGLTVEEFRSMDSYQVLLAGIRAEMGDFSQILATITTQGIEQGILAGLSGAERTVGIFLPDSPMTMGIWVRPDPAAVFNIIGFVDSPEWALAYSGFGDNAVNNISNLLIQAVAQGRNPNQIAAIMRDWTSIPLHWATNIARTSQIYSARLATHAAYTANDSVLDGWMWLSAKDTRTCISCWSQHGMIFNLDQTLNDHHQGRCTPAPLVKGRNWWRDYPIGEEVFENLSPAEQREIFGNNALYNAWRRGEVGWRDFSVPYENPIYGEMLRADSLIGIRRRRSAQNE